MPVKLHIESRNGSRDVVELRLEGELDMATAYCLSDAVREASADHDHVVVDLRGVTFLDSTGLRALMTAVREAEDGDWSMGVVPGPESVQRIFEVTGTESAMPFVKSA